MILLSTKNHHVVENPAIEIHVRRGMTVCHKIGTLSIFSFFDIPKCSISLRELLLNTANTDNSYLELFN